MRREEYTQNNNLPEPYIHCPFTSNVDDIYGRLIWDNVNNVTVSDGYAHFNGTNSYLRSVNRITFGDIKTMCFYAKFNRIPADGVSSTWQTTHFVHNGNIRFYGYLQHFSNENVELTNNYTYDGSYNRHINTLSTPFGSTVVGQWYKFVLRQNQNSADVWIDNYNKTINGAINPLLVCNFYLGSTRDLNRNLDGVMSNLRIWDIALTNEQIETL